MRNDIKHTSQVSFDWQSRDFVSSRIFREFISSSSTCDAWYVRLIHCVVKWLQMNNRVKCGQCHSSVAHFDNWTQTDRSGQYYPRASMKRIINWMLPLIADSLVIDYITDSDCLLERKTSPGINYRTNYKNILKLAKNIADCLPEQCLPAVVRVHAVSSEQTHTPSTAFTFIISHSRIGSGETKGESAHLHTPIRMQNRRKETARAGKRARARPLHAN